MWKEDFSHYFQSVEDAPGGELKFRAVSSCRVLCKLVHIPLLCFGELGRWPTHSSAHPSVPPKMEVCAPFIAALSR